MGGRKIFKAIFKVEREEAKSFGQYGYNLCANVNPVTNISFPQNGGNFWTMTLF